MRRCAMAIVGLAALLTACGGGTVDSSAPRGGEGSTASRAATAAPGQQVVEYGGVRFAVPAEWPVHDLAAAPSTCVRFDVNAVYLGTPSAAMECPAQVIGRADAVLVESGPFPSSAARDGVESARAVDVNGLVVEIDPSHSVEHELVALVPQAALSFTLSFGDSDAVAQQIISSIEAVR